MKVKYECCMAKIQLQKELQYLDEKLKIENELEGMKKILFSY